MGRLFIDFIKGIWIGGTLTVPGVSGGTMAMVLGVYEQLVTAVNNLRKRTERMKSIRILLVFGIGGLVGIFAISGVVTKLLKHFPDAMIFFFTGTVSGGIPAILYDMRRSVFKWHYVFWLIAGLGLVLLISQLPKGLFSLSSGILWQVLGGVLAAVALVLPGISVSHVLYVFGLYESLMGAVLSLNLVVLLPFSSGLILGVLWTAGAVEYLFKRCKTQTYLAILGFVGGSVFEMLQGSLGGFSLLYLLLFAAGYLPIWLLFKYNKAGA